MQRIRKKPPSLDQRGCFAILLLTGGSPPYGGSLPRAYVYDFSRQRV